MILNGSLVHSGSIGVIPYLNLTSRHVMHALPTGLKILPKQSNENTTSGGWLSTNMSSASKSLLGSSKHDLFSGPSMIHIPKPSSRTSSSTVPKAFLNDFLTSIKNFRYPAMTKRPRWWWRVLSCIPYLLPAHESWMYAQTAYHLHHFLEGFEIITIPFLISLSQLPRWFLMAYFITAYLGVVRQKIWPHFFRFHVVNGMLLEIGLQVIGVIFKWMPPGLYWGKFGMHFWCFVAFAHLFTVLDCIICVLQGKYADIPFVSDAAYIQMPYN